MQAGMSERYSVNGAYATDDDKGVWCLLPSAITTEMAAFGNVTQNPILIENKVLKKKKKKKK